MVGRANFMIVSYIYFMFIINIRKNRFGNIRQMIGFFEGGRGLFFAVGAQILKNSKFSLISMLRIFRSTPRIQGNPPSAVFMCWMETITRGLPPCIVINGTAGPVLTANAWKSRRPPIHGNRFPNRVSPRRFFCPEPSAAGLSGRLFVRLYYC